MLINKICNTNDFCVVGNSPCEIGKNQRAIIDSYKYVIRFNDFSLSPTYTKDYGNKVNIWIRATNDQVITSLKEKHAIIGKFDLVVLRAENDKNIKSREFYEKNKINYCLMPAKLEAELFNKLGASPSTGLLFLYWIYKLNGEVKLNKKQVYGFSGFSENVEKKEDVSIHYFSNKASAGYLLSKHISEQEIKFFLKLVK